MDQREHDTLHRFLVEGAGVRGELVRLDASWRAVRERQSYPNTVSQQLGQALAAVSLLAATIKFDGSLILQIQGNGPLRTLVAQATNQRTIRGLARWQDDVPAGDLAAVYGDARLVLTIGDAAERYQGIIHLAGPDLAAAVDRYFAQSEQLSTRVWLAADAERAAGLLLQIVPASESDPDDWNRLTLLADTLEQDELLNTATPLLLHRLYHEELVRLFEPEPIAFRCGCSRQRIEDTLRALGRVELEDALVEQGEVRVDCEFCGRHYLFDAVDVERLFAAGSELLAPEQRH